MAEKKSFSWIIYIVILLALGGVFYYFTNGGGIFPGTNKMEAPAGPEAKKYFEGRKEPTVIKETLKIPVTKNVSVTSGRTVTDLDNKIQTPLVAHSAGEEVVVELAVFTVRGAYETASKQALQWKSDAKLSFVKSYGAVTTDGKSSQWQVVFVSGGSSKSYEVIIQGDAIVSHKEIPGAAPTGPLPKTWFDSDEALKRLAEMPQFNAATISGINFFFNNDAKEWRYVIQTSVGTTSVAL